jgi:hypothetical protein
MVFPGGGVGGGGGGGDCGRRLIEALMRRENGTITKHVILFSTPHI